MAADSLDKKPKQGLTSQALDALLALLDPDREQAGQKYEEIRVKLTKYFQWEGCGFVDEHTDETINRVARAIDQGKDIRDLPAYFFGVARLVHYEWLREAEKNRRAVAELAWTSTLSADGGGSDAPLECLEGCLEALPSEGRDLIMRYYEGSQIARIRSRKSLAESLGLAPNALRNRALRLRLKLEACVAECLKQRDGLDDSGTNIYGRQ